MRRAGDDRLIAARQLVLALRAGLDAGEAMPDRPVDRLIIAELEVEERHLLGASPVTAVKRVRPDEVQRAGDWARSTAGKKQQQNLTHPLADQVEEFAGEIGVTPFPLPVS